jgi:peptide chain release factor 2
MKLKRTLVIFGGIFDLASLKSELEQINQEIASSPNLWDDQGKAEALMRKKSEIDSSINAYENLEKRFEDIKVLSELADEENDQPAIKEVKQNVDQLYEDVNKEKIQTFLSGEADKNAAFLEVHAGAGGTEACDWAEMLLRMYMMWAEKKGYKIETLEEHAGEEAGIKSVTLKISGINAYGWLKTESGVHRLVRISPFDSNARRHTSFASVWVYPVIDDNIEIEINEKDLKIDTYRASGAGGQHVNTTDSAVRITHLPTNIVVQCQNERSQHKNKDTAMKMLKSRLYENELKKKQEAAEAGNATKQEIGWGSQIRSYVMQPYQMVKDLRSNYETSDVNGVLNGDLDPFMEAMIVKGKEKTD